MPLDGMTALQRIEIDKSVHSPLYRNALDILDRGGWAQQAWHRGLRRCLGQALYDAADIRRGITGDEFMGSVARGLGFGSMEDLVNWNDRTGTTYTAVRSRLMEFS